ncbi:MAG: glycosyltransferase family 4 protein [Proteobacteria bacterium]|nr:glycosyltransferase family 4 protein [Pseudomonadota bacterium]
MKILQLVGDWKWTGPAEPMLVLMKALRDRGHQVDLVCPEPPSGSNRNLWQEASARKLDPIHAIAPIRSAVASGDWGRVRLLRDWLETSELGGPYDIVHCWHGRDHVLAARALQLWGRADSMLGRAGLVRFLSSAESISAWPWNRWLFGRACDGLICVSEQAVVVNRQLRGGRAIAATSGAVDFDVLSTRKTPSEIRSEWGVPPGAKLVGVVARMQAHRRFDLLFDALARVVRERPEVCLVLIGRGTREEEVVRGPLREMGLEKNVIIAGYRTEDYADVLSALDLFTFLVPGSDGTCRALLQAAALGLPLVGTRRGAIPEIISNGQTGLLVAEDGAALAAAWSSLFDDPSRCLAMGKAAQREASDRFRPDRFAAWTERFYADVRGRA